MKNKIRILLVDDDHTLGTKQSLEAANFEVTHCADGEIAWKKFLKNSYDLCLLEIIIPKKNGIELTKQIRKQNDLIPILFVTSKSLDEDKIIGFKIGADDYITKPFSVKELLLRIEVFLKRSRPLNADKQTTFIIGKTIFNYVELKLTEIDGKLKTRLSQKEADLLKFFCENANKTIKRKELLYHIWGKDDYFLGRSMDIYIAKLRKHFSDDIQVNLENIHSVGFKFTVPLPNKSV